MVRNTKHALTFIFITLLLDVIGIGIIIPVVPALIEELIHGTVSDASKYAGWLAFSYAIMQFLFAPVLGNLSDRYGRRPILLLSLVGLSADYLLMAYAPTMAWLFVGRLIAGVAGASFTTASAYIVDISTPEKRAQNLGLIGAAFGVGFVIGPVLGGLLGQYGSRLPFFTAAALSLLNFLYGYFILPESLSKENRRPFDWRRANPLGAMKSLAKYASIGGLIIAVFLINTGGHAIESVWTFFTLEQFQWTEAQIGYSLGFAGLLIAFVQGGLIRVVNPLLGDHKSIYVGVGFYMLGMCLFAFASQGWMMYAFTIPYALGGVAGPALQSMISAKATSSEQGELQGLLTSTISLTSIVGPLMMTNLFAYATAAGSGIHFPGAPFVLGALLIGSSLFFIYPVLRKSN